MPRKIIVTTTFDDVENVDPDGLRAKFDGLVQDLVAIEDGGSIDYNGAADIYVIDETYSLAEEEDGA